MEKNGRVKGWKRYGSLGWVLLALVVGYGVWMVYYLNSGGWNGEPSYTGDLPFSERESAAEYSENVVPVIEEFVTRLGDDAGVEIEKSRDDFHVNPCQKGVEVKSPTYSSGPGITLESVSKLENEILIPAGFERLTLEEDEPGSYLGKWQDSDDGGLIYMMFDQATGMGLNVTSGCRPEK